MPARTLINFQKNEKQKQKKMSLPPLPTTVAVPPPPTLVHHHSSNYTNSTSPQFLPPSTREQNSQSSKNAQYQTKSPLSRGTTTNRKTSCIKREPSSMADAEKRMQAKDATDPWMTTVEENLELPLRIRGNPGKLLCDLCWKFWKKLQNWRSKAWVMGCGDISWVDNC